VRPTATPWPLVDQSTREQEDAMRGAAVKLTMMAKKVGSIFFMGGIVGRKLPPGQADSDAPSSRLKHSDISCSRPERQCSESLCGNFHNN